MSDEPTPQGRRALPARRRPAGDLARDLTIAHAKTRAAGHLLTRDPAAAARALHDISHHTRAALDALAQPAPGAGPEVALAGAGLGELLTGSRAAGGALRISVVGVEQPLHPAVAGTVRVTALSAGGFVVAVRLPLDRTTAEDGWAPADAAVTSRARGRTGARIQT